MSGTKGIYVCLFSTGVIKVGRSINTEDRILVHSSSAKCFGVSLVGGWSFSCGNASPAERELIKWCRDNSTAALSGEWFSGVDADSCLAIAKEISIKFQDAPPRTIKKSIVGVIDKTLEMKLGMFSVEDHYTRGRQLVAATGELSKESFKTMDALHRLCEVIRKSIAVGNPAPEWFQKLNQCGAWEVALSNSEGVPESDLIDDINAAIDAIINPEIS